jgi:hypothetical protein
MGDSIIGFRVEDAKTGPLTDGGFRVVGQQWAVDYDRHGNATAVVMWPKGLDDKAYRRGAKAAVKRLRPLIEEGRDG